MSNRLKFLLLAIAVSLIAWGGLITAGLWLLGDGTDYGYTAGTR